jgi:peptidoglycan hydrolase-like protein with peptidoglycan-binding domain
LSFVNGRTLTLAIPGKIADFEIEENWIAMSKRCVFVFSVMLACPAGLQAQSFEPLDVLQQNLLQRSLRKGSRGLSVRSLQGRLKALGYPLKVDGIFGRQTHDAVARFQRSQGLRPDGVCGPKTLQALDAAERLSAPPPLPPTSPAGLTIPQLIEQHRAAFGVTRRDERLSARFYSRGRSNSLRVLKASNIDLYLKKIRSADEHITKSLEAFQKSGLALYSSGADVNFVLAIATRESGANVLRTDSRQVVSGGKDTHRAGASGLDNLWKLRAYFQLTDGTRVRIRKVSKNDPGLRKPNRSPAWIAARDLLFAHLLTTASHEKVFVRRLIGLRTKKLRIQADSQQLFDDLNVDARRAWMGLHYSGFGYVLGALENLLKAQKRGGQAPDLNGILTHDFRGFRHKPRVILARATALRAKIFDILK